MTSLTNNQIQTIINIYSTDPEVKALVDKKIQTRIDEAQAQLAELQSFVAPKQRKPRINSNNESNASVYSTGSNPGSKGHREAIMAAVQSKPGITIGELRHALESSHHNIDNRVLASLVSTMRKEYSDTNGNKGLRAEGEKPSTRYYVK